MTTLRIRALIVFSAVLLVFVIACSSTGESAPDFELTLYDRGETLDQPTVTLADYSGHPVVLNFWATWCGPCRTEMPAMQATFERYEAQGLTMIGIDMGVSFNPSDAEVNGFLDEVGVTYPVGYTESGRVAPNYGATALPTTIFIDSDGNISDKWLGEISESELSSRIAKIIGG